MTVAEKALAVGYRIKALPDQMIESFKSNDPAERKREIQSIVSGIGLDLLPVFSWIERRRNPGVTQLDKKRLLNLQQEASAIVALDIDLYRGGTIRDARPDEPVSDGARRLAEFSVVSAAFASKLADWSEDIARDEFQSRPIKDIERPTMPHDFHFFINHASDDKDEVAIPLHDCLVGKGFKVWIDIYQLTIGDSLRREIDKALKASEYAIAILSDAFFNKPWAQAEIDAIFAIEQAHGGNKRILPVLHKIKFDQALAASPLLAGKLLGTTSDGIPALCDKLARAIQPKVATPAPAIPAPTTATTVSHRLNPLAIEFLKAAADHNGMIQDTSTPHGPAMIRCGKAPFHNGDAGMAAHRRAAELHEALRQLVVEKYVDMIGGGVGTIYQLNARAYELIDTLNS
jgi:hypothetical protein